MKKRFLACLLVVCLLVCFAPAAFAAEGDAVPQVANMSIAYNGTDIVKENANGSLVFTATGDTQVVDYTATVTLSDGAVFTPTGHNTGDLYVESATNTEVTLKFDITVGPVDLKNDQFALVLESTDGTTWTGGFENAGSLTLDMLAGYLTSQNIQIAEGALGSGSVAQQILVNQDTEEVMLALCAPNATVYTVDYVVDDTTTVAWKLPAGATIPAIVPELTSGETFAGWFTDSNRSSSFVEGTTITGNTILYAKVNALSEAEAFLQALKAHENVTISTKAEWDTFVANSDVVVADQLITLGENIDCDDTTYQSMTFAGNFNGNGKTISNATFEATSNTPSGEECNGLFATLGHGQIVANLTLDNIDVEYAGEYAGVLAGMVDGWSNDRALVQNVQVRNSSVSGRSAGGVAGFIRNADVVYCSSRDTTITGVANGGGVVGLNNGKVEYSYSTATPTALPSFLGGSAGGVVGKSVRGGSSNYCWAYMDVVGATKDGAGPEENSAEVTAQGTYAQLLAAQFPAQYWMSATDGSAEFNFDNIEYTFVQNS